MKKVSLFGAYCYNNIGDDLFFYVLFYFFKKKYSEEFIIDIISSNPYNKYSGFHNVGYVYSLNIFQVIRSIYSSEYFIIGPGSIFTSVSKYWKQNVYVFGITIIAKILNKKIIFLGIDFAPIDNYFLKMLALGSLFLSSSIYVRFPDNFQFLSQYLYLSKKIILMSDLVFSRMFTDYFLDNKENKKRTSEIGVIISDLSYFKNNIYIEELYSQIFRKIYSKSVKINFLILNNGISGNKDMLYIKNFLEKMKFKIDYEIIYFENNWNIENIKDVLNKLKSFKFILSNKLHSSILSSIVGTSFVSLSYHEKMRSLNLQVSLGEKCDFNLEELNGDNLQEYLERFDFVIDELCKNAELNFNYKKIIDIINKNQNTLETINF